jgi:pimeloyl-ACP methyl ester carboxylesterase
MLTLNICSVNPRGMVRRESMSLPGRFLTVGAERIFVHRSGRRGAPPLVLLHGYFLSHWTWRHLVPALAEGRDLIAFDWPGHGESDRPSPERFRYDATAFSETLLGVLDGLELERADLLGHSMGGGIALYTAARHPERVGRLAVVDPCVYPFHVPPEARLVLAPFVGAPLLRAMMTRGLIRRVMKRDIYRDPALVTEEWVDYYFERVNRPGGIDAMHATTRFIAEPGAITRSVRAVRSPTLIAWGEDDRWFPVEHGARLQNDIAGSRLEIIPHSGHSPHEERPRELLRVVSSFFRGDVAADARVSS